MFVATQNSQEQSNGVDLFFSISTCQPIFDAKWHYHKHVVKIRDRIVNNEEQERLGYDERRELELKRGSIGVQGQRIRRYA